MVNIVTRTLGDTAKNSPLTNEEVDQNFLNLKDSVVAVQEALNGSRGAQFNLLEWMLGLQCKKPGAAFGAIRWHDSPAEYRDSAVYHKVEPYFASMSVYYALGVEPLASKEYALNWLNFWMNNVSESTGTCGVHFVKHDETDIAVKMETEHAGVPVEDATDSNIALFVLALTRYIGLFGTEGLKEGWKAQVQELVTTKLEALKHEKGLYTAKKIYPMMYLMDNIEVWAALVAIKPIVPEVDPDTLMGKIREHLWNAEGYWHPSYDGQDKGAVDVNQLYPSFAAQLWPVLFGAENVFPYEKFKQIANEWYKANNLGSKQTDAAIALAAAMCGHLQEAAAYVTHIQQLKWNSEARSFTWPFTVADAATMLTTSKLVSSQEGVLLKDFNDRAKALFAYQKSKIDWMEQKLRDETAAISGFTPLPLLSKIFAMQHNDPGQWWDGAIFAKSDNTYVDVYANNMGCYYLMLQCPERVGSFVRNWLNFCFRLMGAEQALNSGSVDKSRPQFNRHGLTATGQFENYGSFLLCFGHYASVYGTGGLDPLWPTTISRCFTALDAWWKPISGYTGEREGKLYTNALVWIGQMKAAAFSSWSARQRDLEARQKDIERLFYPSGTSTYAVITENGSKSSITLNSTYRSYGVLAKVFGFNPRETLSTHWALLDKSYFDTALTLAFTCFDELTPDLISWYMERFNRENRHTNGKALLRHAVALCITEGQIYTARAITQGERAALLGLGQHLKEFSDAIGAGAVSDLLQANFVGLLRPPTYPSDGTLQRDTYRFFPGKKVEVNIKLATVRPLKPDTDYTITLVIDGPARNSLYVAVRGASSSNQYLAGKAIDGTMKFAYTFRWNQGNLPSDPTATFYVNRQNYEPEETVRVLGVFLEEGGVSYAPSRLALMDARIRTLESNSGGSLEISEQGNVRVTATSSLPMTITFKKSYRLPPTVIATLYDSGQNRILYGVSVTNTQAIFKSNYFANTQYLHYIVISND